MTYAYNENYLNSAMKNLGEAFDYAINECKINPDNFLDLLIVTGFANAFEEGNPKIISGLSGTELVFEILNKAGSPISFPNPKEIYDYSPEYWCGWILAYYLWKTHKSLKLIHQNIQISEIIKLYNPLHEAPEEKFVDTLNSIINRRSSPSLLQQQRKKCGYSQKQLSEKAQVNLRTLQQYESKAKDISKASVSTILALTNALNCKIEDIIS